MQVLVSIESAEDIARGIAMLTVMHQAVTGQLQPAQAPDNVVQHPAAQQQQAPQPPSAADSNAAQQQAPQPPSAAEPNAALRERITVASKALGPRVKEVGGLIQQMGARKVSELNTEQLQWLLQQIEGMSQNG